MIIAVEGIDGSGKTMFARRLCEVLAVENPEKSVKMFHFPTDAFAAFMVATRGRAKQLLFASDFWYHSEFFTADYVILDRYVGSYHAYSDDVMLGAVDGLPRPDITFYMATDPTVCWVRCQERGESVDLEEFQQIAKKYEEFYADGGAVKMDAALDTKIQMALEIIKKTAA